MSHILLHYWQHESETYLSEFSSIEWTDTTWNPVRGCTKVSPGCLHCYAETFAERWRGVPGHPYEQGFDLKLVYEKLLEPLRWKSGRRVFVNSMSDLFQTGVDDPFIARVFAVMEAANWHVYQLLTKRAERMKEFVNEVLGVESLNRHIWLGVSVEDRKYGLPRIEHLRSTRASVRFLSIEPLLEDLGQVDLTGIHWVIVGGESGPGARRMDEDWVQSLLAQCRKQRVQFFFKQWGGVRKGETGRQLDGQFYDEMPSVAPSVAPSSKERAALIAGVGAVITAGVFGWTTSKLTKAASLRA